MQVLQIHQWGVGYVKIHKQRARTKKFKMKLHHLRDYVTRGEVTILPNIGLGVKLTNQGSQSEHTSMEPFKHAGLVSPYYNLTRKSVIYIYRD